MPCRYSNLDLVLEFSTVCDQDSFDVFLIKLFHFCSRDRSLQVDYAQKDIKTAIILMFTDVPN